MLKRIFAATAFAALALAVSGCSSIGTMGRSVIALPPAPAAAALDASAPAVVIRSVSDGRAFEVSPRNPSTPSLGPEGGDASVQARAIARKRNGYGAAVGDVLLAEGQTVEGVTREHVVAAFQQAGVRVIDESAATAETPRVDVRIDRFWAWLHPAVMIHQTTHIEVSLAVAGAGPVVVTGHAEGEGPIPPDRVWIQLFERALAGLRADLAGRARQAPFVTPSAPSS
jgi:hypothetical protein